IHASIYDGIRLSHAAYFKFRHNDLSSLKDLLSRHKASYNNIYIAVESVYSMDGDTAPLLEIVDLCNANDNTYLMVDEAHAIGVFGTQGRGLCSALNIEKKIFARVYTYGKAMGCHGATVVGSAALRSYLINFSRAFIYSTALPGHSIEAILCAYKLLIETQQQEKLQENIAYFYSKSATIKNFIKSQSSIHSLVVGDNTRAEELELLLAKNGMHAKAIKSPTVKAGTERVRFCIHAYNTREEIDNLFNLLNVF
ncbi:MAG: aminotransferase class I/II-fold pyridoxal phosphate-dependent enzyme, partial [Bacteroidetes bacterium]|nr:aminotransferase class I/II-fold pyridoxal phosphate-dependent enzyme [Bacteroidota bacterium]